jgi:hypothetical protein
MTENLTDQRASPNPIPAWGRSLAIATAFTFLISSVFPIVAALAQKTASFPKVWECWILGLPFSSR